MWLLPHSPCALASSPQCPIGGKRTLSLHSLARSSLAFCCCLLFPACSCSSNRSDLQNFSVSAVCLRKLSWSNARRVILVSKPRCLAACKNSLRKVICSSKSPWITPCISSNHRRNPTSTLIQVNILLSLISCVLELLLFHEMHAHFARRLLFSVPQICTGNPRDF